MCSPSPRPTMSGTFLARPHEAVGLIPMEHRHGVGACGLAQRFADGVGDVAVIRLLDEVREDLGVGLGVEPVSALRERVPELPGVLDDAVVDDRDGARAVHVGVRVEVVGSAVGRPARVREAHEGLGCHPASAVRRLTSLPARFSTNRSPLRGHQRDAAES